MKKIFIVIIILIVLALAGAGVYYFVFSANGIHGISVLKAPPNLKTEQAPKPIALPDQAKQLEIIKQNFPQVIIGTIKFLDTKDSLKTTLQTSAGTTYILWPPQPEGVYQSLGINSGNKVQVNGKPNGDKLLWALMKPI